MNADFSTIGLSGVAAVLAPQCVSVESLAEQKLLNSPVQTLHDLGFTHAHVAGPDCGAHDLGLLAAQRALADARLTPDQIDLLLCASALPQNHLMPMLSPATTAYESLLSQFRYMGGWLQESLGLERAELIAVTQQGCASMFNAIRLARSLLVSQPKMQHILCVGADVLPVNSPREIMYNIISDAACAVVVSRHSAQDRWLGFHQASKGYYWDSLAKEKEIIAAYFPTSRLVIQQVLAENHLRPKDVTAVLPTGVNRNSWEILLRLVQIEQSRLYTGNLNFGHTIAADNFLALEHLRTQKAAPPGANLLLFTYGFGSSWSAMLLRH